MLRRGIRHAKCGILAGWLLGTIKSLQLRITWSFGVLHDISLTGGEEGTIEYFASGFYRDLVPDAVTDYQSYPHQVNHAGCWQGSPNMPWFLVLKGTDVQVGDKAKPKSRHVDSTF